MINGTTAIPMPSYPGRRTAVRDHFLDMHHLPDGCSVLPFFVFQRLEFEQLNMRSAAPDYGLSDTTANPNVVIPTKVGIHLCRLFFCLKVPSSACLVSVFELPVIVM